MALIFIVIQKLLVLLLQGEMEMFDEQKTSNAATLNEKYHMAGWDSYVTGYCFIKMGYYFAALRYGAKGIERPLTSVEHINGVSDLKCKVNIIRASVGYINLAGEDPESSRPQALIVKHRRNKRVNVAEVLDLLSKYSPFDTMPLGRDALIVAVPSYTASRSILREFSNNESYKVFRYHMWKEDKMIRTMIWSSFILSTGVCLAVVVHWIVKNKV